MIQQPTKWTQFYSLYVTAPPGSGASELPFHANEPANNPTSKPCLSEKRKTSRRFVSNPKSYIGFYGPQTDNHSISITNKTRKLLSALTEISRCFCDVTYCCGGKRATQECLTRKWDKRSALTNGKSRSRRSSNRSTTRTLNQTLYSDSYSVVASFIKWLV